MPKGGIVRRINIGARFGHWTAVEPMVIVKGIGQQWIFRCDCGTIRAHYVSRLRGQVSKGNNPGCMQCYLTSVRA